MSVHLHVVITAHRSTHTANQIKYCVHDARQTLMHKTIYKKKFIFILTGAWFYHCEQYQRQYNSLAVLQTALLICVITDLQMN